MKGGSSLVTGHVPTHPSPEASPDLHLTITQTLDLTQGRVGMWPATEQGSEGLRLETSAVSLLPWCSVTPINFQLTAWCSKFNLWMFYWTSPRFELHNAPSSGRASLGRDAYRHRTYVDENLCTKVRKCVPTERNIKKNVPFQKHLSDSAE